MIRAFRIFAPLLLIFLMAAGGANAQSASESIAAVVNDDIVSTSDLEARLRLALLTSGLADTAENRDRLRPQVLRSLIDETLQRQETQRLSIEVDPARVEEAVARVAEQNGMSPDQMRQMLGQAGIPVSTLEAQIRANIAWSEMVQRRLATQVNIGEEEINGVLSRMEADRGRPEYLLAEIFLSVDEPSQEARVRQLAESLVQQIRAGASFSAVARQFSQSAGAAQGGDMGWVIEGQLDPALDEAVAAMEPGTVSNPIRTVMGYHIMLLRDQRRALLPDPGDTVIGLRRLAIPYPPNPTQADVARVVARVEEAHAAVDDCESLQAQADALGVGGATDAGRGPIRNLPQALSELVASLDVGQATEVQRAQDGAVFFMVCDREEPDNAGPSREDIARGLGIQRVDMLQRRLLRDLRAAAFIDVRV